MRHCFLILLIPLVLFALFIPQVFSQGRAMAPGGKQAVMPPPPPPTPTADLAAMDGQVVNALNGSPLRKANITMNRVNTGGPGAPVIRGNYSASTDASGRFAISGIEPGTYRLSAVHTGFLAGQYNARRPGGSGSTLDLGRAEKKSNVVVKLTPHGVVSGKITDEDGDPLERADVRIMSYSYNQGKKQLQQNGSANTNDLGQYRISGMMPGKYFLSVNYRDRMMIAMINGMPGNTADPNQGDYALTYYPNANDISGAAPIELNPGDQVEGINIRMNRIHTVRISGRVIDNVDPAAQQQSLPPVMDAIGGRGVPAPPLPAQMNMLMRIQVRLQSRTLGMAGTQEGTQVKPDGTFEFLSVAPGAYDLIAVNNQAGRGHFARLALDVGNNSVDGLSLTINPGNPVVGHIRYDGDPPQPLPSLTVRLTPRDNTIGVPAPPAVKVDADGNFHFDEVNADQYTVNLNVPSTLYLKSMRAGSTDVLVSGLDLSNGAGALDILLGTNPPQVNGSVLDPNTSQPAPSVTVVLIPQEKERQGETYFYSTTSTDHYGNFTFNRVTPGSYKVYAWEDIQYGKWFDPDFMKPYEGKGESATAQEGSPVTLKLTMIPAQ